MRIIRLIFLIIFITLKPCFAEDFSNLKTMGKTPLSFLGFKLYDIELRTEKPEFSYDQKLEIRINYNKHFSKKELVETSINEICRINSLKKEDIEQLYKSRFEELFVDVKEGDEKIAIYDPKFGLELYYNGQLTGKINDVLFAKRFIDIWLSEKASFKKVRNTLVGIK